MKIYAVGTLSIDLPDGKINRQRLWFFFADFKAAEKAVLNNDTDMFEMGYYNMGLIEEHVVLDTNENWDVAKQWWYRADFSTETQETSVEKIDQPECFKQCCNFLAG